MLGIHVCVANHVAKKYAEEEHHVGNPCRSLYKHCLPVLKRNTENDRKTADVARHWRVQDWDRKVVYTRE